MIRTFRYRLYPSKTQQRQLIAWLEHLCELHNSARHNRMAVYETEQRSVSFNEQSALLTQARAKFDDYRAVPQDFQQHALQRVDKAFKNFFRRVKAGETPGFPRYRQKVRSLTWSLRKDKHGIRQKPIRKTGSRLNRLHVPKLGEVCIRQHRPLQGVPKTVTLVKKASGWYAHIACELPDVPKVEPNTAVGIDVGTKQFLATSDGHFIPNPRFYRQAEGLLRKHSQNLSRKRKGSRRWYQAVHVLARHHERTADKRHDFLWKVANWLFHHLRNAVVVAEDLSTANMVKNKRLSKSIHDAAWTLFFDICAGIAERDGLHFHQVNPRDTSQTCSGCGQKSPKKLTLRDRTFTCGFCGMSLDRDVNAARNILYRAASVRRRERWVATLYETQNCQPSGNSLQRAFLGAFKQAPVFRLG